MSPGWRRGLSEDYGQTTYLYDADGYRVAKQSGSSTTNMYFYDVAGHLVAETDGSLNVIRTEIYAGDRHLATYLKGNFYYAHANWLGTRRVQTDPAGNPEQTCISAPYGDGLNCVSSGQYAASLQNPTEHHFTGKERDQESGNDYFGARYYASTMGRWMCNQQLWNAVLNANRGPSVPFSQRWAGAEIILFFSLTGPKGARCQGF